MTDGFGIRRRMLNMYLYDFERLMEDIEIGNDNVRIVGINFLINDLSD